MALAGLEHHEVEQHREEREQRGEIPARTAGTSYAHTSHISTHICDRAYSMSVAASTETNQAPPPERRQRARLKHQLLRSAFRAHSLFANPHLQTAAGA